MTTANTLYCFLPNPISKNWSFHNQTSLILFDWDVTWLLLDVTCPGTVCRDVTDQKPSMKNETLPVGNMTGKWLASEAGKLSEQTCCNGSRDKIQRDRRDRHYRLRNVRNMIIMDIKWTWQKSSILADVSCGVANRKNLAGFKADECDNICSWSEKGTIVDYLVWQVLLI